jgi:hypothetical protein
VAFGPAGTLYAGTQDASIYRLSLSAPPGEPRRHAPLEEKACCSALSEPLNTSRSTLPWMPAT